MISDPNLCTLPMTLTVAAGGMTVSDPNAASDHSSFSNGVYTVTGTAMQVQADLQGLDFTSPGPGAYEMTITAANIADNGATSPLITITDNPAAQPSTILGTVANQQTTDETAIKPFAHVTITDPNSGSPTEMVTVTPSSTANGTLSDPNGTTDGSSISNGVYTVSGSASAVTKALDGLVFTPTAHHIAPGQTVTTSFTLTDTNSTGQTATDSATSVVARAVDDPPTLMKPTLSFTIPEGQTLQGLYSQLLANVNDPDFGAQAKLTISSIGQSNTMGFIHFNSANQLLIYTASGFNPNQPTDSFTYTVPDPYGTSSVTGKVDITVTGSNLPTHVGSNATANGGNQRSSPPTAIARWSATAPAMSILAGEATTRSPPMARRARPMAARAPTRSRCTARPRRSCWIRAGSIKSPASS